MAPAAPAKRHRIFTMPLAAVYPLYVQKAEKKGRTKDEVDQVITWLTGYRGAQLRRVLDDRVDFETFFARAPRMNPDARLITGVVCGVRVEAVADPLMRQIRYLDKLVDELARGKAMASILVRTRAAAPGRAARSTSAPPRTRAATSPGSAKARARRR